LKWKLQLKRFDDVSQAKVVTLSLVMMILASSTDKGLMKKGS